MLCSPSSRTASSSFARWAELKKPWLSLALGLLGGCWLDDTFYFGNNDTISRIGPDRAIEDHVTGLPWGDHMPSYPIVGPDRSIYFTVGSATNAGVVGPDNFTFEWLRHSPTTCDIPGQDVTLAGHNFEFKGVAGSLRGPVHRS